MRECADCLFDDKIYFVLTSCIISSLSGLFQDLAYGAYLVDAGFTRSNAALIRSNQFVDSSLDKTLCDIEHVYPTIIGLD